jgi:GTPase SAR1 family protein
LPKLGGAVGAKHSGKTTVIEHLIAEFASRSYQVDTIKEMVPNSNFGHSSNRNRPVPRQEQKKSLPFQDGLTNVQELANLIEKA